MRVALVDGQKLYDLDLEGPGHEQKKANIYKGTITRVEPSLEAAFVDYGVGRHGFLPLKEIAKEYFKDGHTYSSRTNLQEALPEGTEVIVQIEKEERGLKGAALTTYISLAGSFLVLMPNNPRAGGISRRIEGDERDEMKEALNSIEIPHGMGIIIRTAGVGKSPQELEWDMNVLTKLWEFIRKAASERPAPFLIYQESNVILRAVRDYLRPDIGEIIIDNREVYEKTLKHINMVRPEFANRVKLYTDEVPLFTHYQIENQIESAFQRKVRLPSGGEIVIDPTEALTSIDINSAKATKGGDIEETALQTNLEAADEIARQLRLRDLGGLFVIDFIDMTPAKNQREVENRMREAVQSDRARIQIAKISRFGLLELSRQRIRPSINDTSTHVCPRCEGQGFIRDVSSLSLSILHLIEEEALKNNTEQVHAQVPIKVGAYLLNEKKDAISSIEKRHNVRIYIIPNADLETPHYEVYRLRKNDRGEEEHITAHRISEDRAYVPQTDENASDKQTPAVNSVMAVQEVEPAPSPTKIACTNFFKKIAGVFKSIFPGSAEQKKSGRNASRRGPKHGRGSDRRNAPRPEAPRAENQDAVQSTEKTRAASSRRRPQPQQESEKFAQRSRSEQPIREKPRRGRQMRQTEEQQTETFEKRERRERRPMGARVRRGEGSQPAESESFHSAQRPQDAPRARSPRNGYAAETPAPQARSFNPQMPRVTAAGAAELVFSSSEPAQPEHRALAAGENAQGRPFAETDGSARAAGAGEIRFSVSAPAQPQHRDLAPSLPQPEQAYHPKTASVSEKAAGSAEFANFASSAAAKPASGQQPGAEA